MNKIRKGQYNEMKKQNFCITKECLIKALRTFLQTAIGYVLANISMFLTGVDFNDEGLLKNAIIGLLISAFSAGASAVMNLEKGDKNTNG